MILDFIKNKKECQHNRVPINIDEAYCPDCGELVKNKWYLVRCACCDIKRTAHNHYDEIVPDDKFCHNCGATEFYIEELNNINFIDVNYAVYKKETVYHHCCSTNQIWIEKDENLLTEKRLIEAKK